MTEPDWDEFTSFNRQEMECRHTGEAFMDSDFMYRLQALRDKFGPMRITSAYRSASHPIEVNKKLPGAHNTGRAVDVAVSHDKAYALIRIATQMGFTGIGVQQRGNGRFIHLDDITDTETFANGKTYVRPTIWSY